jgi:hypothetical protein
MVIETAVRSKPNIWRTTNWDPWPLWIGKGFTFCIETMPDQEIFELAGPTFIFGVFVNSNGSRQQLEVFSLLIYCLARNQRIFDFRVPVSKASALFFAFCCWEFPHLSGVNKFF